MFVSYRRGDTDGQARALVLALARLVGKDSIFMDVPVRTSGLTMKKSGTGEHAVEIVLPHATTLSGSLEKQRVWIRQSRAR